MNLVLFIGSLRTGGAERQMVHLARGLRSEGHSVTLTTLYPDADEFVIGLETGGVARQSLFNREPRGRFRKALQLLLAPFALRSLVEAQRAEAVYSMLYLTNLIARVALFGRSSTKLIWGLRASNLRSDWRRSIPFQICRWLSHGVDLVVANSQRGLDFHLEAGFRARKAVVVPNGIDSDSYTFSPSGREGVRREWRVAADQILVGLVGRFDPQKGHANFIEAAGILSGEMHHLRFVCIGPGGEDIREYVQAMIDRRGLKKIFWLEQGRSDLSAVYSAIDIVVSASTWGEGFSNVIGEAMSCSRPCVVTDVGDSADIAGETCQIVKPNDPQQLAMGIRMVLAGGALRNEPGRHRVIERYSVHRMVRASESAIRQALSADPVEPGD